MKAAKPKIGKKHVPIEPNINEIHRQKRARDHLHDTQQLMDGTQMLVDVDQEKERLDDAPTNDENMLKRTKRKRARKTNKRSPDALEPPRKRSNPFVDTPIEILNIALQLTSRLKH